jgi:hypothetical protein
MYAHARHGLLSLTTLRAIRVRAQIWEVDVPALGTSVFIVPGMG